MGVMDENLEIDGWNCNFLKSLRVNITFKQEVKP